MTICTAKHPEHALSTPSAVEAKGQICPNPPFESLHWQESGQIRPTPHNRKLALARIKFAPTSLQQLAPAKCQFAPAK